MTSRVYLIVREDPDDTTYFIRISLGMFWESGPRAFAKEFASRAMAVKTLHVNKKHIEGWRIIADVPALKSVKR